MGGGGGQTGGTVVQETNPFVSVTAGIMNAQAAKEASELARSATQDAISAINNQYREARYALQPYRTEGVQALNKLNQYLQLDPYNPGAAPKTPDQQAMINKLSKGQMRDYLLANDMDLVGDNVKPHSTFHARYTGDLGFNPADKANWTGQDSPGLARLKNGLYYIQAGGQFSKKYGLPTGVYTPLGESGINMLGQGGMNLGADILLKHDDIRNSVGKKLTQQQYDDAMAQYEQNLAEYNQNKAWYDQYKAEGPLTSAQITDRITNLPGYQAEQQQGIDTINKSSSARGYLGSGRVLKELTQFGQNTLSKFYGNELDRLSGLASMGAQAAGQTAGAYQNQGNAVAGLYSSLGDTQANASLAAGNALAQGIIAANQQYKVVGQQDSGGGGMGGIGQALGAIGSIASAFSSKALKDKVSTPSVDEILARVRELDIDRWNYKGTKDVHLGPYAEDFKDKFKVGNGESINLIDAVGVLFASVQALSKQLDDLKKRSI